MKTSKLDFDLRPGDMSVSGASLPYVPLPSLSVSGKYPKNVGSPNHHRYLLHESVSHVIKKCL